MFFSKKSAHLEEESITKKSVKKMDKVVTGMILWGIIASIYGVKKLREKNDDDDNHRVTENLIEKKEESSPKKRGILSRILFGNK